MYYGEKFNAWTHFVGALLALSGTVFLVVFAVSDGDPWKILSAAIYGGSLLVLYSVSTLYHSLRGRAKIILRKLDHLSIYLLIAGSYTPFCLVTLRGAWGWSLFGIVWGLALAGMLQELRPRSEARVMSLVIYAVMGWIVLVAISPLLDALGWTGFSGLPRAASFIRLVSFFISSTGASGTGMASGICSCSQAASCTTSRYFFMSQNGERKSSWPSRAIA